MERTPLRIMPSDDEVHCLNKFLMQLTQEDPDQNSRKQIMPRLCYFLAFAVYGECHPLHY